MVMSSVDGQVKCSAVRSSVQRSGQVFDGQVKCLAVTRSFLVVMSSVWWSYQVLIVMSGVCGHVKCLAVRSHVLQSGQVFGGQVKCLAVTRSFLVVRSSVWWSCQVLMVMLSVWWSYQVLMISWHGENKSTEMRDTCCAQESAPEESR